jgi:streptogramin lyase
VSAGRHWPLRRLAGRAVLGVLAAGLATVALAAGAAADTGAGSVNQGDLLVAVAGGTIKHYDPSGREVGSFDTPTTHAGLGGMCFDAAGNLYATDFDAGVIHKYDKNGHVLKDSVASEPLLNPESCVVDSAGNLYVGSPVAPPTVVRIAVDGRVDRFSVAGEARGSDWIDLAADQCTLLYTSEGTLVKRYDVCAKQQLTDLATGLTPHCYAVRLRPNAEVMVACASEVIRLSSSGAVIHRYPGSAMGENTTSELFAMTLDPDGSTFWTAGLESGNVAHVDIESGRTLRFFNAQSTGQYRVGGLVVVGELTAITAGCTSPIGCFASPTRAGFAAASVALVVASVGLLGVAGARPEGALIGADGGQAPVPGADALTPAHAAVSPDHAMAGAGTGSGPPGADQAHLAAAQPDHAGAAEAHAASAPHHGAEPAGHGGHELGGLEEEAGDKLIEAVETGMAVEARKAVTPGTVPPHAAGEAAAGEAAAGEATAEEAAAGEGIEDFGIVRRRRDEDGEQSPPPPPPPPGKP